MTTKRLGRAVATLGADGLDLKRTRMHLTQDRAASKKFLSSGIALNAWDTY